jgi:hypothetical protein
MYEIINSTNPQIEPVHLSLDLRLKAKYGRVSELVRSRESKKKRSDGGVEFLVGEGCLKSSGLSFLSDTFGFWDN